MVLIRPTLNQPNKNNGKYSNNSSGRSMGVRNRNHTKKGSSRMVYDIGLPNSDHAINLPKLERYRSNTAK
jgi:hypothetical protein